MDVALDRADIATLRSLMAKGSVSSAELTRDCLSRIKKHDSALGAVLHLNPEAEDIAGITAVPGQMYYLFLKPEAARVSVASGAPAPRG